MATSADMGEELLPTAGEDFPLEDVVVPEAKPFRSIRSFYRLEAGRLESCDISEAQIIVYKSPTIDDEAEMQEHYNIDYHTLQSSLDPDELSRMEFESDHAALIFKRPKSFCADDNFLLKLTSTLAPSYGGTSAFNLRSFFWGVSLWIMENPSCPFSLLPQPLAGRDSDFTSPPKPPHPMGFPLPQIRAYNPVAILSGALSGLVATLRNSDLNNKWPLPPMATPAQLQLPKQRFGSPSVAGQQRIDHRNGGECRHWLYAGL